MNKRKTVYALIFLIITLFACALLAIFLYPDMFLTTIGWLYTKLPGILNSELWGLRLI